MGCCESHEANRGPTGRHHKPLASKIKQRESGKVTAWAEVPKSPEEEQLVLENGSLSSSEDKASTVSVASRPSSSEGSSLTGSESVLNEIVTDPGVKSLESDINTHKTDEETPPPKEVETPPEQTVVIAITSILPPDDEHPAREDILSLQHSEFNHILSLVRRRSLLLEEVSDFTSTSASRVSKTPLLPDAKTYGYRPCKTVPRKGKRRGRVVWRFPIEPTPTPTPPQEEPNDADSPKSEISNSCEDG